MEKKTISLLILFTLIAILAVFPDKISRYVGSFEGKGSITYSYPEGTEPITSIRIELPSDIASSMVLVDHRDMPTGWHVELREDALLITGGILKPGESLEVKYYLARYIESGSKELTATSKTLSGDIIVTSGTITVQETILLKVLTLILDYRLPILLVSSLSVVASIWSILKHIKEGVKRAAESVKHPPVPEHPTVPKKVEQPKDTVKPLPPSEQPPTITHPEPVKSYCGPDVTNDYINCLEICYMRLQRTVAKGLPFIAAHGAKIDFWIGSDITGQPSCPSGAGCWETMWLGDRCIDRNVSSGILFGLVCNLAGVDFLQQIGIGEFWHIWQYHRLDDPEGQTSYAIGNYLAERAKENNGHVTRDDIINGMKMFGNLMDKYKQCLYCPHEKYNKIRDFSELPWAEDKARDVGVWIGDKVERAYDWTADKAKKGYNWAKDKAKKGFGLLKKLF